MWCSGLESVISISFLIAFTLICIFFVLALRKKLITVLNQRFEIQKLYIDKLNNTLVSKIQNYESRLDHPYILFFELMGLKDLPSQSKWLIQPDLCVCLIKLIQRCKLSRLIEFGSGFSTLLLSRTLSRHAPGASLIAIENDTHFFDSTNLLIKENKLTNVDLVYAPMVETEVGEWYSIPVELKDLQFDLILIDGPHNQRSNGLSFFQGIIHPNSIIIIDDFNSQESTGLDVISGFSPEFELRTFGEERIFAVIARQEIFEILSY